MNFSHRMTKFDIRNYFEKIYNVRVARVNTRIQLGKYTIVTKYSRQKTFVNCVKAIFS